MDNLSRRSILPLFFTINRITFSAALIALLALAGSFMTARRVSAQPWTLVPPSTTIPDFSPPTGKRGNIIRCVRFLDKFGAGNIGFVADSTQIWRTADGGATWALATVPQPPPNGGWVSGWVNDFTFMDSNTGFAAVQGNSGTGLASGVLKTTDGGQTWNFILPTAGLPDSATAIYYNNKTNLLFCSGLDTGLVVSSDHGVHWKIINDTVQYTGFAFIDDMKGVVTTQGSTLATPYYWLRTVDGGQHWLRTNTVTESWQPMGITTTSTFFAATDYFAGGITLIMRSDNNAQGFQGWGRINGLNDSLTQSMAGDGCVLFASSTNQGMFFSVDDGANWNPWAMAPNPAIDTRFYVSPTTVWSFQNDSLFSSPRPGTADIHIWPDTINFAKSGCVTSDTTIHIFGCNCSKTLTVLGDSIHKTSPDTSAIFGPSPLPLQGLCPSGIDSINVTYQPTTASSDTANYVIKLLDGSTQFDTVLQVSGGGVKPGWQQIPAPPHNTIYITEPACTQADTSCCCIVNTSCSVITVTQITSTGPGVCAIDVEIPPLPFTLLPGAEYCLPIHFNGGLQKNTPAFPNPQVTATIVGQSGDTQLMASWSIIGATTNNLKPPTQGVKNKIYKSCCDAPPDTTIYIRNYTCDQLILTSNSQGPAIDIRGTGFTFDSLGSKPAPIHFPDTLPAGTVLGLKMDLVHPCVAGKYSAVIRYNGYVGIPGGAPECNTFAELDSVWDTLSYSVLAGSPTSASASPASFNFGIVSCCDTTETRTVILTGTCVPLTYDGITSFNTAGGNYQILHQPRIGKIFNSDSVDSVVVRYIPPPCDSTAGYNGGFTKNYSGGISIKWDEFPATPQVLALSAKGSSSVSIGQTADMLDFDTVRYCAETCDSLMISNTSCPPGTPEMIDRVIGPGNAAFQLSSSDAKGAQIPPGASLPVVVCLDAETSKALGALADKVIFEITDLSGGSAIWDTIPLSAFVMPPVPGYTITPLPTDTICADSTTTETFIVTNMGDCYTYGITGFTAGANVNVQPQGQPYPVYIPPNGLQTFTVTLTPGGTLTPLTGTITLTDTGGNSITESYNVPVKQCGQQGKFTVTMPGNIIITPNCTKGLLIFTASAGGGTGNVTGVSLTPPGRFYPTNPNGGPMTLTDTVVFDPNLVGGNNSTLTINYTINGVGSGDTTIPLTGIVTGAKDSARIGISSPTDGCLFPNDTDTEVFDVILGNTIQDSLGVTQLSFLIHYNGNLLWNPKFNFPPNSPWSVKSWYEDTMGIHLILNYNGTGTGFAAAGDTIVEVTQFGALSDSLTTTAFIDSTHFNDSAYEACTMKALGTPGDQLSICIDTECNSNIILRALQGTLSAISGIDVIPNPVHKDGVAATLHFTTNLDGQVSADVLDILGNSVVALTNGSLEKGDHAVPISTENLSEGTYFVRIQVNGYTVVRKFSLQKE